MNGFGNYIAAARKKLGLSQKDLASQILKEELDPDRLQPDAVEAGIKAFRCALENKRG